MTLGTPVLLSVKENKLKTTLLSRVAMRNDGTEEYKEELLQELIDGQPSLLPVNEFYEDATHLFSGSYPKSVTSVRRAAAAGHSSGRWLQ